MMLTGHRLVRRQLGKSAFSGEGARRWGGRWNSAGVGIVYLSSTLSLASLEFLVHFAAREDLPELVSFSVRFAEELVRSVAGLPADWRAVPPPESTQAIGDAWVRGGSSAVWRVPSVIIPSEFNYVINPEHPDFRKIAIGPPEPFSIDPRLLGTV